MLKRIGIMSTSLITGPSSAALPRTYIYPETTAAVSIYPTSTRVEQGDKLISGGAVFRATTAGVPVTAKIACYLNVDGRASQLISEIKTLTSSELVYEDISAEFDLDLSTWAGEEVSVVAGQFDGGRFRTVETDSGQALYVSNSFPPIITSTISTNILPLSYLVIDSPPPEGYQDIVVGSDPYYGDERSIVNIFSGNPPRPGIDQVRYSLTSRLGANLIVNPDLTYSGTYPEGVEIPSSDDIYVSYWNDETQNWIDYVVTVNFQQESGVPVNTELPAISGSGVVREQLTSSTGEWSGEVDSFAYRWFVDSVDTGITSQTFTPVDSSYGKLVSVSVTATNQFGSSTAVSEEFGPVAGLAPSINSFVVSGSPYVGYTLTINISSTGVPTPTITVKWFRSLGGVDEEIVGQTGNTYTLTEDDLGYQIYAQVELTNDVGSVTENSDKTNTVSEYRFSAKDISLRNGWYWAFSQMVSILKNLQQQLDNLKGG